MSYASMGEVLEGPCSSDADCGGGYEAKLCCQGACATPEESICADHPKYQSGYGPPPQMPPTTTPSYKPAEEERAGVSGKALLIGLALVAVVGVGGVYLSTRKNR